MLPETLYIPLLEAISPTGADLTDESKAFLQEQLSTFPGSEAEFTIYARQYARKWFVSCSSPPEWIQNSEWQFEEGTPMCFAGQISIPNSADMFHDEARVYVFVNSKGAVKTVLQIS